MAHIVSNGAVVPAAAKSYPLPVSTAKTYTGGSGLVPLLRRDQFAATFEGMYRTQPVLYAAVNKRMNAIARMPLKTYVIGDNDSRERVPNHPLARLLRRPAPRLTEWSLKAHLSRSLDVHGNALALKVREVGPGSPVVELYPVPWQNVIEVSDESGPIEYQIRSGSMTYVVSPEEVLHVKLPDGVSPLEALVRTLALEDAAATWQGEAFRNGATPRGAFVTEQRLTDAAMPRLREELTKLYAGPENGGKFAVLDNGMKFQTVSQSAVDAELMAQRKFSREEVCAALDLDPALFGFDGGATYASRVEARRSLYDSIASRLALIEETFNAQIVADVPAWDGIFAEFDSRELLRLDPEAQARADLIDQQSSTTSLNERRRARNLPPIEDPIADAVMVPVNMTPVGPGVSVDFPALGSTTAGTPEQGQTTVGAAALNLALETGTKDEA